MTATIIATPITAAQQETTKRTQAQVRATAFPNVWTYSTHDTDGRQHSQLDLGAVKQDSSIVHRHVNACSSEICIIVVDC